MKKIGILLLLGAIFFLGMICNNIMTPAKGAVVETEEWSEASLYDIVISEGMYMFNGKECLVNNDMNDLIHIIIEDDSTVFPADIAIEVKYIADEDLYVANLIDTYILEVY